MDFEEYRKRGKEMVDYIADYLENIRDRQVFPNVKPGYMHNLLPDSAPVEGEQWENIFEDIERVIMPGITHWQSPHMHAYFPALNSFPSLLGDMLADAINCLGFTWASSPACTELETIVMNWLGKMIGLPDEFLHLNSDSNGGGVIQTTASESTLVCLLAGRTQAIKKFHEKTPGYQDAEINARLVAYCSDQAHSSVEKAALIGLVRMRYIESDDNFIMHGKPLEEAIEDDIKKGLIPFWVCCTLGTTGACAFDNLDEVGSVCNKYKLWLHIDAAYAGSALICPEYRAWLKGIQKADSIAFNPSKWLMVHFDCTAMWVKDSTAVHRTFNVEPLYLQHENSGLAIDYMHWQIPLSKRFRSLKLWFVLRSFGIKGLQAHIREGVRLAQKFEALVLGDHRFEIPANRYLGLVVFRIKGENDLTEKLLKRLNHRGNLHCVPASLKGKYIIRFTVTSTHTTSEDILNDWSEIKLVTSHILDEMNIKITDRAKVSLKDTKEKNEAFGSSLLLSNAPMSPKIVNGSFAAIFDEDEFLAKTFAGIRISHQDSPSMRRRVRGILMSGKQFSLDSRMDLVVHDAKEPASRCTNPIREDSEDVWEAYESPGTPPTPSPQISPLLLYREVTSKGTNSVERRPQTLSIQRRIMRPPPPFTGPPDIVLTQINSKINDNLSSPLQSTEILNDNIKHFLSKTTQFPEMETNAEVSKATIYPGKRFLEDPIINDYGINAFYNHAFGFNRRLSRTYDNNIMDSISEIDIEDIDWNSVKDNFSAATTPDIELKSQLIAKATIDKTINLKIRVNDETGQRVKTSFDGSCDDSVNESLSRHSSAQQSVVESRRSSAATLWSSYEEILKNKILSRTQSLPDHENVSRKYCRKCGHCSGTNTS